MHVKKKKRGGRETQRMVGGGCWGCWLKEKAGWILEAELSREGLLLGARSTEWGEAWENREGPPGRGALAP